jgi:hypothetical protein
VNDEPHGKGMMLWPTGDMYRGEFVAGKQHGFGVLTLVTTGQRYEGNSFLSLSLSLSHIKHALNIFSLIVLVNNRNTIFFVIVFIYC